MDNKLVARRKFGLLRSIRDSLVKNWCLKRSRIVYAIASRCMSGEVRINVAMRCREDGQNDWGHAWVTHNGKPLWEFDKAILLKEKTKIADNGIYTYWIYN